MWKKMDPKQIGQNVFSMIGEQWMLVTAGTGENCNTMTASWGGLGVLWNKPVATAYIRPQRYTRQFMDEQEYFTLSFFGEEFRDALALCGRTSGRDTDKVKECGFTLLHSQEGAPYFDQAELVLVCRKQFVQQMDPDKIPEEIRQSVYPTQDYHYIYIGEITEALVRE